MTLPDQLAHLAGERRWCWWRYETVKGRRTKVPHGAKGRQAKSNDPSTWLTFSELPLGAADGPGIFLGDGLQGVDLDACLDADGILEPWAAEVVTRLASYTEVSPSGRGLKVFFTGTAAKSSEVSFGDPVALPDGTTKRRELALFVDRRFFTVTGQASKDVPVRTVNADDIAFLQEKIEALRQAERDRKRSGEMLAQAKARGERAPVGGDGRNQHGGSSRDTTTLSDLGITRDQSYASRQRAKTRRLPAWLRDLIEQGAPEGERSEKFYKAVRALQERGLDAAAIEAMLASHPGGIAAKFIDRLGAEIERVLGKAPAAGVDNLSTSAGLVDKLSTNMPTDDQVLPPEFSDDHLAVEFVAQYGCGLRWSPGLDWMRDTGTHWTRDDHLVRYNAARLICRQAAAQAEAKLRTRIASAKTVGAVVSLAQSDPKIVVPADRWDRDAFLLNTPKGVVDLRTGRMRARTAADYLTQITEVAPDSGMGCPTLLRFIGELFADEEELIEFVQRLLGYMLTGDRREQLIFFFHGSGANGKSTLLDLVLWIVGSYGIKLPATALMQSQVDRHPTELAQLRGKRFAVSNELEEGMFWAEARLKELTGDETLTARYMRQDFFEFRQTQKHVVAGNHKPRLRGGDPAIARRMVLVPFLQVFDEKRKDMTLPERLRAEAPAVLAWMIDGARKWYADGLAIPSSVRSASRDYLADHDDVALWIDECCERAVGREERSSDLYQSFALWKKARGEHAPSQTTWGQRMALVPGIVKRSSNGVRYSGLGLTIEAREALHNRRAA